MPKKMSRRRRSGWIDFAAVKQRVSIEQVLKHYGLLDGLEEKDDGYRGPCPFHEGDSPRPFHVSTSKNAWYCHGCEEGGNVLDFAARMEDASIRKAAGILTEAFGLTNAQKPGRRARGGRNAHVESQKQESVPVQEEPLRGPQIADLEKAHDLATSCKDGSAESAHGNKPLGFALKLDPGHELLLPLGFDRATIERFEAGYCSRGMMAGRLAVPIHSSGGELLGYAGWSLGDEGWKFPPRFSRQTELYNLHRAAIEPSEDSLVVVSDILDVWRLASVENVVAFMGETISDRQEMLIRSAAGRGRRVILALACSRLRNELLTRLASQVYVHTKEPPELLV